MEDIRNNVGVIILAGGKSSRMGRDKGIMPYKSKPMIQWVIDATSKITSSRLIVANNPMYSMFSLLLYKDIIPDLGPIGGLYTGLYHSEKEYNVVLSCDTPNVTTDLIRHLLDQCTESDVTIAKKNDRTHQLIGIYRKSALEHFKEKIDSGVLKMRDTYDGLKVNIVDCESFDDDLFRNVNTKEDLERE